MLVFSTRLPLKSEVSHEDCMRLFIEWIEKSKHYPIDKIIYDLNARENYDCTEGNISFSIRHYTDLHISISACRLENREKDAIWFSDCILIKENSEKSLLVQLNCNRINYAVELPYINKPYIVRKFIESGFCKDDAGIPIIDVPLASDNDYFNICSDIICNKSKNIMPVVYVSCDHWDSTYVSATYLAKQLSGVAHVFEEKSHNTALKLREVTNGKNVHNGFVGLYFPDSKYFEKFSFNNYENYKHMSKDIIFSVRNALINRLDASVYNWNHVITLQSRQRISELNDISEQGKQQLQEYMKSFDSENKDLEQKVDELNQQVFMLKSQLDSLRYSMDNRTSENTFFKYGKERDFYLGEQSDLLHNILQKSKNLYAPNSRAETLIQSLLEANPTKGESARVITEVRKIFHNYKKLTPVDKSMLESLGFKITEDGPHYKMVYFDNRYNFTISKTPSDYREGRNLVSEICNKIKV